MNLLRKTNIVLSFIIISYVCNGLVRAYLLFFNNVSYIIIILFFIWLIVVNIDDKRFMILILRKTSLFALYFVSVTLFLVNTLSFWHFYFFPIVILSFYYFYFSNLSRYKRYLKFLFVYLLIDQTYLAIRTAIKLINYPDYSRLLAGGGTNVLNVYDSIDPLVAGYGVIYGSVLLIVLLIVNYGFYDKLIKFLVLIYSLFTTLMILMASYAISVIILIAGLFLVFFANLYKKRSFMKIFSLLLLVVLVTILLRYFLIDLLVAIANQEYIPKILSYKLLSIVGIIDTTSGYSSGSFELRLKLYNISLQTFKSNILFGISRFNLVEGASSYHLNIGGHSQTLDDLARYGLLRMSLCYSFIYVNIMNIYKRFKILRIELLLFTSLLVVLSYVNTIDPSYIFLVLFLLCPIKALFLNTKNKNS